jgi:hypothetical protein
MTLGSSSLRAGAIALLVAALAAPVRGDGYDPYRIPRAQFREQVARVVLRPLQLPAGTPDAERVRSDFEGLIADALTRRGYTVVPSRVRRDLAAHLARSRRVFDPVSGDPIRSTSWRGSTPSASSSAARRGRRVLGEIAIEPMPFGIGFWYWEAAGQTLRWRGHGLPSARTSSRSASGRVSRRADPGSRAGAALRRADPARVVAHLPGPRLREVPAAELYADREHNQEAVAKLLEPLVDRKDGGGDD